MSSPSQSFPKETPGQSARTDHPRVAALAAARISSKVTRDALNGVLDEIDALRSEAREADASIRHMRERLTFLTEALESEARESRNMTHDEIIAQCTAVELLHQYRREFDRKVTA